jgi:ribosomal protein S18 acetylase RimI-like enzyme
MSEAEIKIVYARPDLLQSYHACLDAVAREGVHLEMTEAPPLKHLQTFQLNQIMTHAPAFFAVNAAWQVVGWCDVVAEANPRHRHRGGLGMGVHADYRRRGVGSRLLEATLAQSKTFGFKKVELKVYTTNEPAIALYRTFGFEEEGLIRDYRRFDTRSFDCMLMGKFI